MYMILSSNSPHVAYVDLPEESNDFYNSCCDILSCEFVEFVSSVIPGIVLILDSEKFLKDGDEAFINERASYLYTDSNLIYGDVIVGRLENNVILPLSPCDTYVVNNFLNSYCPF